MPWRVYNILGIDIDSNCPKLNYKDCLAYPLIRWHYYKNSKNWIDAEIKIFFQMEYNKKQIVSAEEIYFSDKLEKVWESDLDRNQ